MKRRKIVAFLGLTMISAMGWSVLQTHPALLVWNKTESAPKGLYMMNSERLKKGHWAVLDGESSTAQWIAAHGYIGKGWPVIKRVVAIEGDIICRQNLMVSINGKLFARAIERDIEGNKLPHWSGCKTLNHDEYFLINDHPLSLDGRYFGAESETDLIGSAVLVWRSS